jgi:membrane associated rhomboid family serine protease
MKHIILFIMFFAICGLVIGITTYKYTKSHLITGISGGIIGIIGIIGLILLFIDKTELFIKYPNINDEYR